MAYLPAGPVQVTVDITGTPAVRGTVTTTAKNLYPNGKQCGAASTQADLAIDNNGTPAGS